MSWTDKKSLEVFKLLRDDFSVKSFIETGTFRGINSRVHSHLFQDVLTCENNPEFHAIAKKNLEGFDNVSLYFSDSKSFLKITRSIKKFKIYYLDAHFYDPNLPKENRFVVKKELEALRNCNDCIIAIHDFDNGELGHLVYDGIPLNFDIIKNELKEVNPDFNFYTNRLEDCDPITMEDIKNEIIPGVPEDDETEDTVNFVWSSKEKTYRGILYCIPGELDLDKYPLRKFNV